jgi:hypothetical protein
VPPLNRSCCCRGRQRRQPQAEGARSCRATGTATPVESRPSLP